MNFRIADTFTSSLARLTGEEQKAVKTTAFDLQLNPANPGMSFHKLERVRDKGFWSVRVSDDLRLIVHRSEGNLLLCYVDHHDKAYHWAERRKLVTHPTTGAAQLVELREETRVIHKTVVIEHVEHASPLCFQGLAEDTLLQYGAPEEWVPDLLQATESNLFELLEKLPDEAAEALLLLATGETPAAPVIRRDTNPFDHPDAQRRFRLLSNREELEMALDAPWHQWTVFLHPSQRELVEREFNGPARVSGSAGTGKTVVALHRAFEFARRHPESHVLLTTFSEPLLRALQSRMKRLAVQEPAVMERLELLTLDQLVQRTARRTGLQHELVISEKVRERLRELVSQHEDLGFSQEFVWEEWSHVVDAWGLATWEEYRDIARLGRKSRLPEGRRLALWSVYKLLLEDLKNEQRVTLAQLYHEVALAAAQADHQPFDCIIVDEAQDLNVYQLRLLAALSRNQPNSLFFAGDLGQRIFQPPFSWKALGVDVCGRSSVLRVNYRTSHQIRQQADRLLPTELQDVDGNLEERHGTVSAFNGPEPVIHTFASAEEELEHAIHWVRELQEKGIALGEIALFVRTQELAAVVTRQLADRDLKICLLDEKLDLRADSVSVTNMHLAKGLEFRAVAVLSCNEDLLPLQSRVETAASEAELDEILRTEGNLLYVACTRAREFLMISAQEPGSELLVDIQSN